MNPPQQLTPRAALLVGLVFVASGMFPMLAAFDIGPLSQEDINGPPWLGFVAGGVFTAAGLAVMAGPRSSLAASLFGLLSLAGLAMLGNWIAFGAGAPVPAAFRCPGCGAKAISPAWAAAFRLASAR